MDEYIKKINNKMRALNVVERDEDFIGTRQNLKEYFMLMIHLETGNSDYDAEEFICNIGMLMDLLEALASKDDNELLEVKYNPMGAYYLTPYGE